MESQRTPNFRKWSLAQGSQNDLKMNQTSSTTNPNLETELDQHGNNLAPKFHSLIQQNTRTKMAQRGQPKRRGAAVCRREASSIRRPPLGEQGVTKCVCLIGKFSIPGTMRRHTADPISFKFSPQKCIQNFIDFLIDF